jgi:hypothetical protein
MATPVIPEDPRAALAADFLRAGWKHRPHWMRPPHKRAPRRWNGEGRTEKHHNSNGESR